MVMSMVNAKTHFAYDIFHTVILLELFSPDRLIRDLFNLNDQFISLHYIVWHRIQVQIECEFNFGYYDRILNNN